MVFRSIDSVTCSPPTSIVNRCVCRSIRDDLSRDLLEHRAPGEWLGGTLDRRRLPGRLPGRRRTGRLRHGRQAPGRIDWTLGARGECEEEGEQRGERAGHGEMVIATGLRRVGPVR